MNGPARARGFRPIEEEEEEGGCRGGADCQH